MDYINKTDMHYDYYSRKSCFNQTNHENYYAHMYVPIILK